MQIKKTAAAFAALIIAFTIAGCGNAGTTESTDTQAADQVQTADQTAATETDEARDDVTVENDGNAQRPDKENDILIVYFSAANLNDVDAVTSATPLIDGVSTVEWMANIIQESTGADIVRIVPSEDYPLSYDDVADAAKKEADNEVAASGFAYQIKSMVNEYSDTFHLADNEVDGNVSYRLYEGGTHGPEASNQYTFNGLLWFWNDETRRIG